MNVVTKEQALRVLEQIGSLRGTCAKLGIGHERLKKILGDEDYNKTPKKEIAEKSDMSDESQEIQESREEVKSKKNIISEKDLLAEHDPETRATNAMRETLRSLGKGQYMRDMDLRRECHANDRTLWHEIRALPEFWLNVVVVGNTSDPMIYWGNTQSVRKLIEQGKARRPVWVKGGTI